MKCEKGNPANQANLRHLPGPRPTKPGMSGSEVPEATNYQRQRLRPPETYGEVQALGTKAEPQGWVALERPGKKSVHRKAGRRRSSTSIQPSTPTSSSSRPEPDKNELSSAKLGGGDTVEGEWGSKKNGMSWFVTVGTNRHRSVSTTQHSKPASQAHSTHIHCHLMVL